MSQYASRPLSHILTACLLLAATSVRAEGLAVALRLGKDGSSYESGGITLRLGSGWTGEWLGLKASLRPEVEVNHLRYSGSGPGPQNLNALGGLGLFRLQARAPGFGPYAEIGLGGALLSRDNLGSKEFSTHFQFSEHVGLGLEFGGDWFAGWRYSHYSNANIERPNAGIDLHQLMIGVRF